MRLFLDCNCSHLPSHFLRGQTLNTKAISQITVALYYLCPKRQSPLASLAPVPSAGYRNSRGTWPDINKRWDRTSNTISLISK